MKGRQSILFNILIIILLCCYVESVTAQSCTMTGTWNIGGGYSMLIDEIDHKVNVITRIPHPYCGYVSWKGTNNGKNLALEMYTDNPECAAISMRIEAEFIGDACNKIAGKQIIQVEGLPDRQNKIIWFRDLVSISKPKSTGAIAITAEPKMPALRFESEHASQNSIELLSSIGKLNTRESTYKWHLKIEQATIPAIAKHAVKLDDFSTK